MKERTFAIVVILGIALPTMAVLAYNLYIDPFQIFHKDLTQPTVLLGGRGTDRYQQAGIINQYDIGSVIIGHSHAANFLPLKVQKELSWEKVYTLTMDGSPLYENAMVVEYVLSKHKLDNVLWGVHVGNFMNPWESKNKKLPLKEYLYDLSRFNDLRFLLTFDLQKYEKQKKKRKRQILESENSQQLVEDEFNRATSWYNRNICGFNRPTFVADKVLRGKKFQYDDVTIRKVVRLKPRSLIEPLSESNKYFIHYKENLHNNLLSIIRQHPETTFHFVVTAYPTLRLQKMKIDNPVRYKGYLKILRQFVIDTHDYKNIKLFGFDNENFTNDLRLYKDQGHYHLAVNNYIIEEIALDNNRLTVASIDDYILALDEKVSSFRLRDRWNPQLVNEFPQTGYLSLDAARMLIHEGRQYSDVEITEVAFQGKQLPECAVRLQKIQIKHHKNNNKPE
ncbi:MAG: hypothetical protein JKY62_14045 [Desulfocapsa sp.]|nr:hypothetical protein [Desulfocapsa sp.]